MRDYARPPFPAGARRGGLQVCLGCAQPFVVPDELLAVLTGARYLMRLRCTNCRRVRVGIFDEDEMTGLDVELSRSQRQIERDVELFERARFEQQIETFALALRYGHLLPEDF